MTFRTLHREPLLLLPGTACDGRVFAPMIERLDGYPVIVGEMRGARTMPDLASRLLVDAPATFALAGFSLGGIAALEMIAQAPHRVSKLALMDTTARPDPAENAAIRRKAAAQARRHGMAGFILDVWPRLVAPANTENRALRETILAMARDCGPELLVEQTELAIHRADSRPRLPRIRVPTLVLAGIHEQVCPLDAHREIAQGIPEAALQFIPDAGHFAPLENPQAVAGHVLSWLAAEETFIETPRAELRKLS